jgi:glycosyltransferase involved in cell wall biosynthesis
VSPWLLRADLFLYASQEDYVPNSIIEAQGRGLPLVVNDFAGLRALLAEGRNARFFRSGSPADAASTVSGLLADAHSMRTMAMANRDDTASTYSAPAIMERLIPLVEFVRNRSTSDA